MKQYSIFHPWLLSFYSKSLYRDVVKNWRGLALRYLLLLLAVSWIPMSYSFMVMAKHFIHDELFPIADQLPTITIEKGQVSIDQPSPYFIRAKDNQVLGTIDTSGHYASLTDAPGYFLLTKTKLYFKEVDSVQGRTKIQEQDLSKFEKKSTFDKGMAYRFLTFVQSKLFLFYPVVLLLSFLYRFIQIAVYSIVGLIFCAILKAHIPGAALVRITVMAITPSIILSTIFDAFNIGFPHQLVLYFVISMVYLFYGIFVNRDAVVQQ